MEFYYDGWSYEPDSEELEEARHDIVLDTIKWEITQKTGKKQFSKEEINYFKIIAKLVVDGQFESINDNKEMYDEFKDYFCNKESK